jgi:hypothetical protein
MLDEKKEKAKFAKIGRADLETFITLGLHVKDTPGGREWDELTEKLTYALDELNKRKKEEGEEIHKGYYKR